MISFDKNLMLYRTICEF